MAARPTEFTLWLEEALTGWIVPVAGLAAILLVGGLYALDVASEEATAALDVAAVALGTALFIVKSALAGRGVPRVLALAAAAATALAVLLPALPTVWPSRTLFEGELAAVGDRIALPSDAAGKVRLLVAGRLREAGEPSASYELGGADPAVAGRLERTYRQVRVGRGGRARVASDHTADWYDATLPAGAQELTLRRLSGQLGGKLLVSGHRPLLPAPWPWVISLLALALAALAEARLGRKNAVAVPGGMALTFGLLVTANATPYTAVGPVLGAVALGAIVGSLVGWVFGIVARRLVPAE